MTENFDIDIIQIAENYSENESNEEVVETSSCQT